MNKLIEHRQWKWQPGMVVVSETTHSLHILDYELKTTYGQRINDLIKSESIIFPTDHSNNVGQLLEMLDKFNPIISVLDDRRFSRPRYTVWCRPTYRNNATVGMFSDNILGFALSKSLLAVWEDVDKFYYEELNESAAK